MALFKIISMRRQAHKHVAVTLFAISLGLATATLPCAAQTLTAPVPLQQATARNTVDLRVWPDSISPIVQRLAKGAALEVLGEHFGPWVEVRTSDGDVGWLQALDLAAASASSSASPSSNTSSNTSFLDFFRSKNTMSAKPGVNEPLPSSATAAPAFTTSAQPNPEPAETLTLSEQRLLQAQTYRAASEEARRFAFQAQLERVRLIGKFDPVPSTVDIGNVADEAAIGREVALALLGNTPLHSDISLQTYINLLGRWTSLESASPDLAWTFAVLDSRASMVYALPGGTVLITQGLIEKTTTEAELAGILAHAIAHVVDHHHLKELAAAADATPTAGWGNLASGVYAKGLAPDDEMAADRRAVVMLTRAGFNPWAVNKTIALTGSNATAQPKFFAWFASLAGPDEPTQRRLAQIKTFMGSRFDAYADVPSQPIPQRLEQLNSRLPPLSQ
jgi:beta-barrel assembly-enhancing protease